MQIEISQARRAARPPGCHRTWSKTLESLANPLESLRVRLQAALRSVAERASELGVLLVHYSKPGSAQQPTFLNLGMLKWLGIFWQKDTTAPMMLHWNFNWKLNSIKCIKNQVSLLQIFIHKLTIFGNNYLPWTLSWNGLKTFKPLQLGLIDGRLCTL